MALLAIAPLTTALLLSTSSRLPAPRMALNGAGAAISIRDLAVWAGSSELIEKFDWRIMPNERWSLLGPNGCGKSTLLRTIASAAIDGSGGELSNNIIVNPRLRFGMLEQTAVSGSDRSVRDEVMSRMGAYQSAKAALEAAESALEASDGVDCTRELEVLDDASEKFESVGGYTVDKVALRLQPKTAAPVHCLDACVPGISHHCLLILGPTAAAHTTVT